MTFKYMYCCKGTSNNSVFKYCHMPLDTYTLEWFCDEIVKKETGISVSKIKNISWSNLEYGKPEDVYSYMWIQNKIRNYLKGRTLLEAEFYIWSEQQMRKSLKDISNQMFLDEDYPYYDSSKNLYDKLQELSESINNTLRKNV